MAILCDMHSLMPVGFFMFLSMSDFLPECLFAVVVIKYFMIGVNFSCNQCIDTWQ